jgi:hypothetical protein
LENEIGIFAGLGSPTDLPANFFSESNTGGSELGRFGGDVWELRTGW